MIRNVERVITAHRQEEGAGFVVRRPFPAAGRPLDHETGRFTAIEPGQAG